MSPNDDTDALLDRAATGDSSATQRLLDRHRERLGRMVAVRLDRRLAARLDPSDVVQEALMDAARKLPDYLRRRPLPFYAWLRGLAWERLVKLHEQHLTAGKRSVLRELPPLPDESALALAARLLESSGNPTERAVREEMRQRVRAALSELPARDREVLVMRYLEQLSTAQTAAVLGVTEGLAKVRHLRALERLRRTLGQDF